MLPFCCLFFVDITISNYEIHQCNLNKHQRIPKRKSKIDNPEELATQDEDKHNTICVGHNYANCACLQLKNSPFNMQFVEINVNILHKA